MSNKTIVSRGRRFKYGSPLDVKREIKFTEDQDRILQEWQERTGFTEMGELMRETLLHHAQEEMNNVKSYPLIPLLGSIPAGPAADITPETPGVYIKPPYDDLPEDCYALTVHGNSMESEFGITVKNGFYALFAPGVIFPHAIVHVEFSDGEFHHKATLKKYVPKGNGMTEFRPLNKSHKPIVVKDEVFTIKGGFIKAWDGVSGK